MTTRHVVAQVWFTTKEATVYARCSYSHVIKSLEAGTLKGSQRGAKKRWLIHVDDLDRWLNGYAPSTGTRRLAPVRRTA